MTTESIINEIAAERQRQIEVEGWTPEHDDEHEGQEMALAAACYAIPERRHLRDEWGPWRGMRVVLDVRLLLWPWKESEWRPKERRRDLLRAAALIVAEIERLDRAEGRQ